MTMTNKKMSASGESTVSRLSKDIKKNYSIYLLMLPVLFFYLYFCYKPMYGLLISFQDFSLRAGIGGSKWIGFENFRRFFSDAYFSRNIINTIKISFYSILFGFPVPIIFAIIINELRSKTFAKVVQTITYMPHFISLVVVCSMVKSFVSTSGLITNFLSFITKTEFSESLLNNACAFVPIYVLSDIWQNVGWNAIIYIAAIAGIDQSLYEAAAIDGANRFKQTLHVTLPCLSSTIIVLFILRLGTVLTVGYEKIILLNNAYNAEASEVLSYYIYKKGIINADYGLSTAAGVFNSVINAAFVITANSISHKVTETGLW